LTTQNLKCQVWNCSRKVSELYTDFYTNTEFTDQFIKLNAVTKEYIDKDFKSPVINVKMIDLNRQTMPLYKRLDDKNKSLQKSWSLKFKLLLTSILLFQFLN